MELSRSFKAYMKTNLLETISGEPAFTLWGSTFWLITDGKLYGIAEELSGCLICGDFKDFEEAIQSAKDILQTAGSSKFNKRKRKLSLECLTDMHDDI